MLRTVTETIEDGKGIIKHADIHLRIRTLIAETGRGLRTVTETIEDGKGCRFSDSSPFQVVFWGNPFTWGEPEVVVLTSQTIDMSRGTVE